MTAIEDLIAQLKHLRMAALSGDERAAIRFANLVLGAWPTIQAALEDLDKRRIA